mgnify:CR=1 FL=1
MAEREFIERIAWDTDSIVDVAIDTSIEVLRAEGNISAESMRRIGQRFAYVRSNPHLNLTILAPDSRTALVTFIPPFEYTVNRYDLDIGELLGEAQLVVYNPLSATEEPGYRKLQMELILTKRLAEVSGPYYLKQENLVVTFPPEHYSRGVERYVVPVLG